MRLNPDRDHDDAGGPPPFGAGSLLLAHPSLRDPHFRCGVVLLTAYSEAEGALGVVLNRPVGQTLGQYDPKLSESEFSETPLYYGGPVAADQLILVAWKWNPGEGSFKLYFGIDDVRARQILEEDPDFRLRGFLGHAGWGKGQIEAELETHSWVISPLTPDIESAEDETIWRDILSRVSPEMRLLAEAPDDPSLN